jgi:hypothetical protein
LAVFCTFIGVSSQLLLPDIRHGGALCKSPIVQPAGEIIL